MQKRICVKLLLACFTVFVLLPVIADSEPVNGDAALKKILAEIGISASGENANVITKAKQFVSERQAQKKRTVVFKNPVCFEEINHKYISVFYELDIKPEAPGVASLLFERSGEKLVFAEGKYLLWVGQDDMKEYKNITMDKICDYYRKLGANDCFPVVTHARLGRGLVQKADLKHFHGGEEINSGIIKEQYIDDAIARDSEVKAMIASISTRVAVVPAPVPVAVPKPSANFVPGVGSGPNERIAALEAEVKRLSELLKDVTRANDTIVLTNLNLQVVNGAGSTESANGKGNIIIGYNAGGGSKGGSHNLVVGSKNSYSSYGGIIAGSGNSATGKFASAVGGTLNTAQGDYSTVVGGEKNNASGTFSIIAGGVQRSATNINPHFSGQ